MLVTDTNSIAKKQSGLLTSYVHSTMVLSMLAVRRHRSDRVGGGV
jgi:hypothetical protein